MFKRFFKLLVFASALGAAHAVYAASADDLAFSAAWLKLLHYDKTLSGSYKGLVDNQKFYAAPDGRYNPQNELQTEIELFDTGDKLKCEFPARFKWLKKQGIISGNLSDCSDYNNFMKDVRPDGITLLFTDAFMNNPASLFGHTLIRIDTSRKGSQMLAHGSNFGANSGTDTGPVFALKGLFGGYEGGYVISPYWDIINTYNNIENRDIWEYHLNLTLEEQEKFTDHLYEMKNATVRYFFLTKNCSYMILELLEAVRPELDLTSEYVFKAIPLDTLKKVKSVPGLVGKVNYRPARYTKLKAQIKKLNAAQYEAFRKGITGHDYGMENLAAAEKPAVLEAEYQYYQYEYTAKNMELHDYRRNSFAVLRKRSALPAAEDIKPEGKDPSLSHASFQISAGGGVHNRKSFEQINIRPAYTGLTDDNYGLIKGAGISVLESSLRYYNRTHKTVLQRFTGLKADSFVPSDSVFSPWSYMTDLNIHREYNPSDNREGYVGEAVFGMGKTYALTENVWFYGLLNAKAQYGGFIPGGQLAGIMPKAGVFTDFGAFKADLSAERTFPSRKFGSRAVYAAEAAYSFTKNLSLAFIYNVSVNESGHDGHEYFAIMRRSF